jgi:uncharacterized membrane protein YadS
LGRRGHGERDGVVMYAWIWRKLPGKRPQKVALAVVLVLGVTAVLFLWVFPWIAPLLPFQQQTVGG